MPYEKRKQWFLSKVGQTIYRTETTCQCEVCKHGYKHGVFVNDESHARYICEWEGQGLAFYFDTTDERDKYELENYST